MARVNSQTFRPGDNILFKRGQEWRETLVVSHSGVEREPITFGGFGTGPNPRIWCSDLFARWTLEVDQSPIKIWKTGPGGLHSTWGAMRNGSRVPCYLSHATKSPSPWQPPPNLTAMSNGFFYAPRRTGTCYFRWDAGDPGPMEIGTRDYGIYIKGQQYVVIDGIDVHGPGGRLGGWGPDIYGQVCILASHHVVVKNSHLAFHSSSGVTVGGSTGHTELNCTDCKLENLEVDGHGDTGIYFKTGGYNHSVLACTVHDCGTVITDYGDMGLVGIWQTPHVSIEASYFSNNAHFGAVRADAAISFVQSPFGTVNRCLIKNAATTALQFAEASDNGTAAYNIIDGWGTSRVAAQSHDEGIRIGGGSGPSANNCRVYNNLFINGGKTQGRWAALRVLNQKNLGLRVINNVFYNNVGVFEVIAESSSNFADWVFASNCYFRTTGQAVEYQRQVYG